MTIFGMNGTDHVVNVASVPKRSPFRYPGGKTWLIPRIRQWLHSLSYRPSVLVEPFAGGGIVGLSAAFEELADHVVLVEVDDGVAAVWRTMLEGDADRLVNSILSFEVSHEKVRNVLADESGDLCDHAFRTILRNRMQHGGIMAPGASLIKHGENGKGLRSRWYPETLAKRIRAIASKRDRFTFVQGDGLDVMRKYGRRKRAVYFIDPPYTAGGTNGKRAGTRLYKHFELDHDQLFRMCERVAGDILLTYDNAPDVRAMAQRHGFETKSIAMKNTHHAKMNELLIGRNLDWAQ